MQKILVIEDEPMVLDNIDTILKLEGFQTVVAENGSIGLELAKSEQPNLIICDVMMPGLDGYEVLSALRQDITTLTTPFIFLTAKADRTEQRQGMELGADDYLTKPFTPAELLRAITTRLSKQQAVIELQQKITTLQSCNDLKDNFIETASNELRAPIANIRMAIQMLKHSPNQERLQKYLTVLQAECAREIELIDDLIDLQRLETNARPLNPKALNLQNWLPTIVEPLRTRARERRQTLQLTIPPYLPVLLLDCFDLKRLLTELLNNACKYTAPSGRIMLEVHRAPDLFGIDEDAVPFTTFVVSNESDIPAEALSRLFEQFYRVPDGDRWQQGGSGLGLTIVRKLAERMGGKVKVTSKAGWTQFAVYIPAESVTS